MASARPQRLKMAALALSLGLLFSAMPAPAQPRIDPGYLLHDQAGVVDDPAPLQAVLSELEQKTGIRLWVVTLPELSGDMSAAAEQLLENLSSAEPGLLLLLVTARQAVTIKSALPLDPSRLGEIQRRIIIPKLRRGDMDSGLLEGAKALAHLAAQGTELSFAPVAKERPARFWQKYPLEAKHLLLPGGLVLWYLIAKLRRKRKNG